MPSHRSLTRAVLRALPDPVHILGLALSPVAQAAPRECGAIAPPRPGEHAEALRSLPANLPPFLYGLDLNS